MRHVSLGTLLFTFWLALSGHYTAMLIGIGAVSSMSCLLVAQRMGAADREAHPSHLFVGALSYFPWLVWEIIKSAWAVAKVIVNPKLPISPTMTVVKASQRSPVGIVIYANSITLTPGTITTHVRGNQLTVHALVRDGALDLEGGGMDARVKQFEGSA